MGPPGTFGGQLQGPRLRGLALHPVPDQQSWIVQVIFSTTFRNGTSPTGRIAAIQRSVARRWASCWTPRTLLARSSCSRCSISPIGMPGLP